MRRFLTSTLSGLLLAAVLLATPQTPEKKPTLRCTLTDTKIEKCCCEQKDGKLYCPLAKKAIEKCCCESLEGKKSN